MNGPLALGSFDHSSDWRFATISLNFLHLLQFGTGISQMCLRLLYFISEIPFLANLEMKYIKISLG